MKKTLITLLFVFMLSSPSGVAYCAEISAEQHVHNFYQWYITVASTQSPPLGDDAVYQYVNHCVVQNIKIFYARSYFDADYFTNSQDIWKGMLDVLVIHEATKVDETTSIVPISFKWAEDIQQHMVVFVQNEQGNWRITKVASTDFFH